MSVSIGNPTSVEESALSSTISLTQDEQIIKSEFSLLLILYCIVGCIGFLDNLVVILTISLSPSMRKKRTNWFLLNQSVIDLVTAVFLAVNVYRPQIRTSGLLGDFYCHMWHSTRFMWTFAMTSTYNLLMITIERFVGIVHPVWHKNHVTKRHFLIGLAAPYAISNIYYIYFYFQVTYDVDRQICIYFGYQWVGITAFFLQYAVPLALMIFCYTRMVFALTRRQVLIQMNEADRTWMKARFNVIKTLVWVCIAYAVCWSWNQIYYLLLNFGLIVLADDDIFYVFSVVAIHINCAINPFIYATKYTDFQRAFVYVWKKKQVGVTEISASSNITQTTS